MPDSERIAELIGSDHRLRLIEECKADLEKADGLLRDLGFYFTSGKLAQVISNVADARANRIAGIVDEVVKGQS